jgi:hypothetical protein
MTGNSNGAFMPPQATTMNDLVLVSVDDRIIEPPDMFERLCRPSLAARHRASSPLPNGEQRWSFDGKVELRRGLYDVHARVDDMNPHADSTWPRSPEDLWGQVKDFPREQATAAAPRERASHVDTRGQSLGGGCAPALDAELNVPTFGTMPKLHQAPTQGLETH